jgi:hypothetical protein
MSLLSHLSSNGRSIPLNVRTEAFGFMQDFLWRLNHRPDVLHLKSDCFLTQLLEEQVIFFLKIKQSCNPEKKLDK